MTEIRYWTQLATEQFPPSSIVRQATAAERAGFEAVNVSDHFQPWWEPGHSGHAWVMLGAIAQATELVRIGTGVTAPVYRHHLVMVAQAFTDALEELAPGRAFVGIGSGESLNESPAGMDWPPVGEQIERMDEALEIIGRLFDGERSTSRATTSARSGPSFTPSLRGGPRSTSPPSARRRRESPPLAATGSGPRRPRKGPRRHRRLPRRAREARQGARRGHPPGRLLLGRGR